MKTHLLLITLLLPVTLSAQFIGGNSIAVLVPSGDFGETHTVGLGLYGNLEYELSEKSALLFELGWAQWSADDELGNSVVEDLTTWSLLGGINFSILGPLYIEGRGGYYFNDLQEWALIPAIGLRLGKFDLNVGANVLDPVPFWNGRIGFFWAK